MKQKVCKECGKVFTPTSPRQTYCGTLVHDKCAICGNEITYRCGHKKRYCSPECSRKGSKLPRYEKVCESCGDVFLAKRKTDKYCHKEKTGYCPVCGKEVTYRCGESVPCCSTQCINVYKGIRYKQEKSKKCYTHTCVLCGKEYTDSRNTRPDRCICPDQHYYTCEVCGKEFPIPNDINHRVTCSDECRYVKTSETNKLSSEEGHIKLRETCLRKYGTTSYSKTDEFRRKCRETNYNRYGKVSYTQTEEYIKKSIETNRRKYGKDWHTQTEQHKQSVRETNLKKYGADNVSRSRYFLSKRMTDPSKVDVLIEFRDDPQGFIDSHFDHRPTLTELSKECGVVESSIGYILNTQDISDCVSYHFSKIEDEIYQFLRENLSENINIVRNTFKVITPYELDLYIPSKNVGIELNPTYTHNSTKGIRGADGKSVDYHLDKTLRCEDVGVFLFHVFGYEWTWKSDIIKSMLLNICGSIDRRIYARQTRVKPVTHKEAEQFLNENHRQGSCVSSVRIGLYLKDELVSVMTFSKMRNTMGTGSSDLSDCVELTRFCSKLNTSVIGGASKLFSYYVRNFKPVRIRSFSDRAHTRGNLYRILGFNKIHVNRPSYRWVNPLTDESYSRVSTQKRHLNKLLGEENVDMSKTEIEIMEQNGYVRVYDCGTVLWEWTNRLI